MPQSVSGTWDALYAAIQGLFPASANNSTLVTPGPPGDYQPDLIIAVMGVKGPITQPTLGTNRSRDKHINIEVAISAYVHGGPEAQQPANDAAWAAADLIEAYFRTSPNEKFGGACYNSFVEVTDMEPAIAWEAVDGLSDPVPAGRTADITMTVTAWIRI
jgi:hypothetical protein